jgi:hypothetical protein
MIDIFGVSIYEASIALTDLILFLESGIFAVLLARRVGNAPLFQKLSIGVFLFLAASSLTGAVFHAFFPLKVGTSGGLSMWIVAIGSIGFLASTLWALIVLMLLGQKGVRMILPLVGLFLGAYFYTITFVDYQYLTVIFFYAPPVVLLGVLSAHRFIKSGERGWGLLGIGVGLSILAALIQVLRISIDPTYLSFNTLYHLVQAIALFFLYRGFALLGRKHVLN